MHFLKEDFSRLPELLDEGLASACLLLHPCLCFPSSEEVQVRSFLPGREALAVRSQPLPACSSLPLPLKAWSETCEISVWAQVGVGAWLRPFWASWRGRGRAVWAPGEGLAISVKRNVVQMKASAKLRLPSERMPSTPHRSGERTLRISGGPYVPWDVATSPSGREPVDGTSCYQNVSGHQSSRNTSRCLNYYYFFYSKMVCFPLQ